MFDWHTYRDFIEQYKYVIGLLGILIIFSWRIYEMYRGTLLIKRVLLLSWHRAFSKMLFILNIERQSQMSRFGAARRLVELEIIHPEPEEPNIHDFRIEEEYNEQKELYEGSIKEREIWLRDNLQKVLKDPVSDGEAVRTRVLKTIFRFPIDIIKKHVLVHLSIFRRIFGRSTFVETIDNRDASGRERVILRSFKQLDDNRDAIKRYFNVLSKMKVKNPEKFLTAAELEFGYVSPLFLLTGILNRFDEEEGWKNIIDKYRPLIESESAFYSQETRDLRAFMFNCWLLWGPSISPCSCPAWDKDRTALQYGYGDENQSIDLIVNEVNRTPTWVKGCMTKEIESSKVDHVTGFHATAVLAAPSKVGGVLGWGPGLKVAEAQGEISDPSRGRIVLECDPNSLASNKENKSNYYTAYLWIMFVLQDEHGKPFFSGEDSRWRNLLCYFEHGNIADPTTFQSLKENLIAKTCSSLTEIFSREFARGRSLKVVYACALDDTNCQRGDTKNSPSDIAFHPDADKEVRKKRARIIDIMRSNISGSLLEGSDQTCKYPALLDAQRRGYLVLDPAEKLADTKPLTHLYSSCQLPQIISGFYKRLEAKPAETQVPQKEPTKKRADAELVS